MKRLKEKRMRNKRKIKIIYEYIGDKLPELKKDAEKKLAGVYDFLFTEITKKYGKQMVNT